jgi:hypothetical protein
MWNTTKDPVARPASRNLKPQKYGSGSIISEIILNDHQEGLQ